ncbi:PQQ-dependent sugar dehydrogenase [Cohnella sp. GCM10027633]|uniref:PQQ-dependent sugar dehydrogenase n=1 Tax=unclassified Cohnella TaxID=2636738 RepID=UPI00362C17F1
MTILKPLFAGALLAASLTACFGAGDEKESSAPPSSASAPASSAPSEPSPSASAEPPPPSATQSASPSEAAGKPGPIALRDVFEGTEFNGPVGVVSRQGYPNFIYVVEQPGRIVAMNLDRPSDKPATVLDITDRVYDEGGEQGLLGLAFHPDEPNRAYVNYTTKTHTVIASYDVVSGDPLRLDPKSEDKLLTFKQPYANHNGGQLAFGPDGYLYIGTGDGGSGGDPQNNSQNLNSYLGKILRIDIDRKTEGLAYGIPADNPFLKDGLPEIYAYGLRNPWRFSFDEATGKLWAADVGQSSLEEIDLIEKGGNYGWRIQEGTACYNPKSGCDKEGLVQPIHEYGRDLGVSVTGGYVYRGEARPDLKGWYVFGDYGSGMIWALRQREDGKADVVDLLAADESLTSFGTDAAGELYVCAQDGRILRIQ